MARASAAAAAIVAGAAAPVARAFARSECPGRRACVPCRCRDWNTTAVWSNKTASTLSDLKKTRVWSLFVFSLFFFVFSNETKKTKNPLHTCVEISFTSPCFFLRSRSTRFASNKTSNKYAICIVFDANTHANIRFCFLTLQGVFLIRCDVSSMFFVHNLTINPSTTEQKASSHSLSNNHLFLLSPLIQRQTFRTMNASRYALCV